MHFIPRFSWAVLILTFLVIIAGGVVRTTQSGMGCPDWPKCFGKWIPPMSADELPPDFEKYLRKQDIDHSFNAFHTWTEYINRLLGALLGLIALIQFLLLFKKRKEQKPAFQAALVFLVLVILTGLFGALVVKYNLAHLSITVHLAFALLMTLVQVLLLVHLYKIKETIYTGPGIKNLMLLLMIALFVQFALGTGVRIHVDDISKELNYQMRELWLNKSQAPTVLFIHGFFSWFVLICSIYITWLLRKINSLRKPVIIYLSFVLLNMLAGAVLTQLDMPALVQPLHLLVACAAISQWFYLLLITRKAEKNRYYTRLE